MVESSVQIEKDDVSQHYDQLDSYYRHIWGEHVHHGLFIEGTESVEQATRQLSELVARRALIRPGQFVVDVGCGYGGTSRILADEFGARVTGLTISEKQLALADAERVQNSARRKQTRGSLDFRLEDWLHNSLPSSHFDAVVAVESTEHMDKRAFLEQAFRVLKPGGTFAICAWCEGDSVTGLEREYLLEPICREGRIPDLWTADEYLEVADDLGFDDDECEELSENVRKTWSLILARTAGHFLRHPSQLLDLSTKRLKSADFAKSLLRINLAYRTGAMSYNLLTGHKPHRVS